MKTKAKIRTAKIRPGEARFEVSARKGRRLVRLGIKPPTVQEMMDDERGLTDAIFDWLAEQMEKHSDKVSSIRLDGYSKDNSGKEGFVGWHECRYLHGKDGTWVEFTVHVPWMCM
jgi:hypothetical protein